jgi:hypothetical protein
MGLVYVPWQVRRGREGLTPITPMKTIDRGLTRINADKKRDEMFKIRAHPCQSVVASLWLFALKIGAIGANRR